MDFAYTPKVLELRERLRGFMDRYIVPRHREYLHAMEAGPMPPADVPLISHLTTLL